MSVSLEYFMSGKWQSLIGPTFASRSEQRPERSHETLTIGLINNMPDSALAATERQFISLLNSASRHIPVRFRLYSIGEMPRGQAAAARIAQRYADIEQMWDDPPDALIVTGREPHCADLRQEPYWVSFVRVLEWAHENTCSTVWSCLAAHAAVQYMDGITRVKSNQKYCGVFECAQVTDHILTSGAPARFRLPHSRWNGLNENDLTDSGYTIITRSELAGVDTFVKYDRSLFVFFQGHPEYEPKTLLLEYRRDIGRYLREEAAVYPAVPLGYFDHRTATALSEIASRAQRHRCEELLNEVSSVLQAVSLEHSWRATSTRIYSNWLQYLIDEKSLRLRGAKRSPQSAQPVHAITGSASGGISLPLLSH